MLFPYCFQTIGNNRLFCFVKLTTTTTTTTTTTKNSVNVGKSVYIGYNAPFVWIAETRGTHCASYILSQVKFGYRSGADPNPSLIRNSGKTSSAFGHVRLSITGDPYNRSFFRPSHSLRNALLPKKQEPYFFSPRVTGISYRLLPAFFILSYDHVSLHKH